jgi:hypothetical protein
LKNQLACRVAAKVIENKRELVAGRAIFGFTHCCLPRRLLKTNHLRTFHFFPFEGLAAKVVENKEAAGYWLPAPS